MNDSPNHQDHPALHLSSFLCDYTKGTLQDSAELQLDFCFFLQLHQMFFHVSRVIALESQSLISQPEEEFL